MPKKGYTPEQIINKLREAEMLHISNHTPSLENILSSMEFF
ncbi:MAG: hypothetical protein PHU23_16465 [Dehalococcoidales bacterium]|nr:hypothetical protein [Dehalococcoidales bacterium]